MKIRNIVAGTALVAASFVAAAAPVAYKGVLVPSVPDTGSVGGFSWFLGTGSAVDFWRFAGLAGETVTLSVSRLNGNLDQGCRSIQGQPPLIRRFSQRVETGVG